MMRTRFFSTLVTIFFVNYSVAIYAQTGVLNAPLLPNTLSCSVSSSVCIDASPTKLIQGFTVPVSQAGGCWTYQDTYNCIARASDCLTLQSSGNCKENTNSPQCAVDGSGNPVMNAVFGCTTTTHTYTCTQTPGSTTTTQDCNPTVNLNGLSWSSSAPNATADFINAVAGQEIQGQIAKGLSEGIDLFGGEADKCQIKLGFKNCCQSGGGSGGGTNQQIAQSAGISGGMFALKSGAAYAVNMGSPYVYDALTNAGLQNTASGWATDSMMNAGGVSAGGFGFAGIGTTAGAAEGLAGTVGGTAVTSSTMGITSSGAIVSVGAANAAAASSLATANALGAQLAIEAATEAGVSAATSAAYATASATAGAEAATAGALSSQSVLFFNPYMLAAMVAIMIVMAYLECDESDMHTSNIVSKNLCHYVGSYCSQKAFAGLCLATKQSYCCYNGLLAKEIQEGAHNQLGLSWGSPESPSCGGLGVDQIASLDFGAIDLSQFKSDIQSKNSGLGADALSTMQGNITTKIAQ